MLVKTRTREVLIWLGWIILVLFLAIVMDGDNSPVIDGIGLAAGGFLILSLSINGWRLKKGLKKRMETGLGRQVGDSELTSITTWMRIPDQAARASRMASKFDFNT